MQRAVIDPKASYYVNGFSYTQKRYKNIIYTDRNTDMNMVAITTDMPYSVKFTEVRLIKNTPVYTYLSNHHQTQQVRVVKEWDLLKEKDFTSFLKLEKAKRYGFLSWFDSKNLFTSLLNKDTEKARRVFLNSRITVQDVISELKYLSHYLDDPKVVAVLKEIGVPSSDINNNMPMKCKKEVTREDVISQLCGRSSVEYHTNYSQYFDLLTEKDKLEFIKEAVSSVNIPLLEYLHSLGWPKPDLKDIYLVPVLDFYKEG